MLKITPKIYIQEYIHRDVERRRDFPSPASLSDAYKVSVGTG